MRKEKQQPVLSIYLFICNKTDVWTVLQEKKYKYKKNIFINKYIKILHLNYFFVAFLNLFVIICEIY